MAELCAECQERVDEWGGEECAIYQGEDPEESGGEEEGEGGASGGRQGQKAEGIEIEIEKSLNVHSRSSPHILPATLSPPLSLSTKPYHIENRNFNLGVRHTITTTDH